MKKLFTTFIMVAIGVITSWAQVYTVEVTSNNPELGEVEIIPCAFSVSATKKVRFSPGNLQYQASTKTWRFAEHQYDYIGNANSNISPTYSGWIDLFGWGTGKNPTNTSTEHEYYSTFEDWGVNKISNGGNQAGLWRTLTNEEWNYLFNSRTNYNKLWSFATVNGISGLVLLPDLWCLPSGLTFTAASDDFGTNVYTVAQWTKMENAGAVFLPAAGCRYGTRMDDVGTDGDYWSSTYSNSSCAYGVSFGSMGYNASFFSNYRPHGHSVRLCTEISSK